MYVSASRASAINSVNFLLSVTGCVPRFLSLVSVGDGAATAGEQFDDVVARVESLSGAPEAGVEVELLLGTSRIGLVSAAKMTSDAQGLVQFQLEALAHGSGSQSVILRAECADDLSVDLYIRSLRVNSLLPSNPSLLLRLASDIPSMPILLAADAPLPSPGFAMTPVGPVHTSVRSPQPTLLVLGGFGLFGPPDPTLLANPSWYRLMTLPSTGVSGLEVVFQVYGLVPNALFPDNILISNPVILTL